MRPKHLDSGPASTRTILIYSAAFALSSRNGRPGQHRQAPGTMRGVGGEPGDRLMPNGTRTRNSFRPRFLSPIPTASISLLKWLCGMMRLPRAMPSKSPGCRMRPSASTRRRASSAAFIRRPRSFRMPPHRNHNGRNGPNVRKRGTTTAQL